MQYLPRVLSLSILMQERNPGNEVAVFQWKDVISDTTNQKHYPDLGSDEVASWHVKSKDVRRHQCCRREMSAVCSDQY